MDLTKEVISRYYTKIKTATGEVPLQIDHMRLSKEITYFLEFMKHLPLESYSLDLIQSILDLTQAGLLKHSLTLFRETISVLQENDLLTRHEFIYSIGVIYSKILDPVILTEKKVDNMACRGLISVDRKQPIMDYVYNHSKCPFCKQVVQIRDFIEIILDFTLQKGGLTFAPINKGETALIHKS